MYIPSSSHVGNLKDSHSETFLLKKKTKQKSTKKPQHQMSCAYGFQLKAQKVLFVGTAPVKAILCYTTVKTDHHRHKLQTSQAS